MKKTLSIIAMMLLSMSVMAQTNFRHISFADALKAAKAEKKLVFVDFYTSWCGPCKMMARDIFPQKKVGDFMNERFVCVKYDAEKEELELVKKSQVKAYPTFVIFDADGNEINRKEGGSSADAFIADMDRLSDVNLTPDKIKSRYENGERTPRLIKAYMAMLNADMYNSRRDREAKKQKRDAVVNDYFNSLSDKDKLSSDNFFLYSDCCEETADLKIQYLFTNKDKVNSSDKAEADSILKRIYTGELLADVSFSKPFDKSAYTTFRQQCLTFDFAKDPEYEGMIDVLDAYATGDLNNYLEAVKKNAGEKCGNNSLYVYYGLSDALKDADKAIKQSASTLIRSRLATMPATDIMYIGQVLGVLEK